MGELWTLELATAAKHRLYRRYLNAWWPKLLQSSSDSRWSPQRVTYVDAFAGPGRYLGGEEGSPIIALKSLLTHQAAERMRLSRDRVRLVFLEKDRGRFEFLQRELRRHFGDIEALPVRVVVRNGEAGRDTFTVLDDLKAWGHPILAIFDSWGNVNVPLPMVRRLAHNPSTEVITTLGPNWFSRRQGEDEEQLDAVFGGREYWTPADKEHRPDERWRVWLSTYRSALHRAGFRQQLHFQVVPKTGVPLYLVFGTGHPKGVEAMKDAMWHVDGVDGMGFRDPRTRGAVPLGQGVLWGDAENPQQELLELVCQRLTEGPATLDELREWLLLETSRWRAKDAAPAVKNLESDRQVVVDPPGRLTKQSRISLR